MEKELSTQHLPTEGSHHLCWALNTAERPKQAFQNAQAATHSENRDTSKSTRPRGAESNWAKGKEQPLKGCFYPQKTSKTNSQHAMGSIQSPLKAMESLQWAGSKVGHATAPPPPSTPLPFLRLFGAFCKHSSQPRSNYCKIKTSIFKSIMIPYPAPGNMERWVRTHTVVPPGLMWHTIPKPQLSFLPEASSGAEPLHAWGTALLPHCLLKKNK